MACLFPVNVKVEFPYTHFVQVPCGKCVFCKQRYQQDWLVRLYEESLNHSNITFFTLTYNETTVPKVISLKTGEIFHSVCKKHVQNWLKRFRENYLSENHCRPKFKYFITSEYGPRTFRPHYHGLIFGLSSKELISAKLDWSQNYGFTDFKDIPSLSLKDKLGSAGYVSKYCSKGMFENPYVSLGIVRPTFHLISKGIGKSYIARMRSYHLCTDTIHHTHDSRFKYNDDYLAAIVKHNHVNICDNHYYRLPRYYSSQIFNKPLLSRQIADYSLKIYWDCRLSQAEQLQAKNPSWSFGEALYNLDLQNYLLQANTLDSVIKRQERFYNKSKL